MDQRRELPVVEQQRVETGEMEVAPGHQNYIFDVPVIGAAGPVIKSGIAGIRNIGARVVALRVRNVEALRPGVIGHKAEAGGEAMLDSGDQSVVVGHADGVDKDCAAATAQVLIALCWIRNGKCKT
jgi:hypothetical protein